MKPALNLAALACTLRGCLNEKTVSFTEQDDDVVFDWLEPDKGQGLHRPRLHEFRLKKPSTIQEAFDAVVQAGIIEDNPEKREDFWWDYKHYETLPPRMLELECL
jgi:hypothetical protein